MRTSRGVSLVEVLLASCLLIVVIAPILTSGSAIHRRTSHTEYRAIAAIRARTIIELLAATDFEVLRQLYGSGGEREINLNEVFELGAIERLNRPSDPSPRVQSMLERFRDKDKVTYQALGPHLARLDVRVHWEDPGGRAGSPPLELHLSRLVYRPESTLSGSVP